MRTTLQEKVHYKEKKMEVSSQKKRNKYIKETTGHRFWSVFIFIELKLRTGNLVIAFGQSSNLLK